ncbi:carbohydrate binding domain-containing protein, partial [Actinospica sp.]|uniref:carbohydrate binding domain-containing protein n=1 Tax=Actinospica sp. TaxID=1872142 RepID=UPI002CDA43C9
MQTRRPRRSLRLAVGAAAAALVVPATLYLSTGAASAAATNLVGNAGFESGNLSGWTCDSGTGSVVTSPVHSGSYALAGAPTSSDDAQCTETVSVQANTTYTLSAYVEGSYVYLGDTGGSDTWTPSATSWQQLSMSLTTGASQTSLTIYIHGWYAQPTYHADDFSLTAGTTSTGSPTTSSTPTATNSPSTSPSPTPTGTGTVGGGSVGKVAPYVDMSNNQESMLNSAAQAGLKSYTAAFVISAGCSPIWGDTLAVTGDPAMDQEIATAKADGATPIVSF